MVAGGVGVWWLSGGRVEVGCGLGGGGVAARRRMVFVFVCSFALYPLVALAMQLMTLPGLVLPAGWVVRQSTETARSFTTQLVPPKTTRFLLGKAAWNGIGNIHCPMLIGRMCVSEGGCCYTSVHFYRAE